MLAAARAAFDRLPVPPTSDMQDAVDTSLIEIAATKQTGAVADVSLETAVRCERSGYYVDAVMQIPGEAGAPGTRAAVLAADRKSYLRGNHKAAPTKLLGDVALRHRQLRRNGWKVVIVPYWEWDAIGKPPPSPPPPKPATPAAAPAAAPM